MTILVKKYAMMYSMGEVTKMGINDNKVSSLTVEEVIEVLSDVTLELTIVLSDEGASYILSPCN